MKIGIDGVNFSVPRNVYSHNGRWAFLWSNKFLNCSQLGGYEVSILKKDDNWDDYDTIYLYHGINFGGSLNLFGGALDYPAKQFERIATTKAHLVSLDIPMPDYGELCKGRLKSCSDYWSKVDWDAVSEKCKTIGWIKEPLTTDHLVIGDSHSFSVYTPGAMTLRKDGRTLSGVLKKTIAKEIADGGYDLGSIKKLTCYWGNIDIRHHMLRESNPNVYIDDLFEEYERQLKELNKEIELVYPVPIEDESRRLPKTGYFKGTPFFGSRLQRQTLVEYFKTKIDLMAERNRWSVWRWPATWYTTNGIDYMKEYMERPSSVHLSGKYYRWDLEKNKENPAYLVNKKDLLSW